ncbi:hypothetical protein PFISCL1PPCAC_9835, partial [Pristionchus fissidentatus]
LLLLLLLSCLLCLVDLVVEQRVFNHRSTRELSSQFLQLLLLFLSLERFSFCCYLVVMLLLPFPRRSQSVSVLIAGEIVVFLPSRILIYLLVRRPSRSDESTIELVENDDRNDEMPSEGHQELTKRENDFIVRVKGSSVRRNLIVNNAVLGHYYKQSARNRSQPAQRVEM